MQFFDTVYKVCSKYGGEIVKFGGDSCLVLFYCTAIDAVPDMEVVRDDLGVELQCLNQHLHEEYRIDFRVHGGAAIGKYRICILGNPENHLDYYIDGSAVANAYDECVRAGTGEILIHYGSGLNPSLSPKHAPISQLCSESSVKACNPIFLPKSVSQKLSSESHPAELRNAAVLFLNLESVGSAEIDPWHLNQVYLYIQKAVYRYDGVINKIDFTEKGYLIIIVFGIPFIHTDDIERAFICARSIIRYPDPAIQIRIGMNYSNIYAGLIGAHEQCEYGIIGNAVNIAARLMSFAKDREISLSGEIVPRINSLYETQFISHSKVKGIREEVSIYLLIRELPERWALYRNLFESAPLVAFQEPIGQAVHHLNAEPACLIRITGAKGCGKSFIVWQLGTSLIEQQNSLYLYCADHLAQNNQFDLLHKVLLQTLGITDLDSQYELFAESCQTLEPTLELGGMHDFILGSGKSSAKVYTSQELDLMYDNLAGIVRRLLGSKQLYIIENIQYLDSASQNLVARMIKRQLSEDGKAIISSESTYPLPVSDDLMCLDIPLSHFTAAQSADFIRHSITNISQTAVEILHQISGGNPRFLNELVMQIRKHYNTDSDLITDFIISDMKLKGIIPDSIENLMIARYEELGEDEQTLLKQTAIFGRPFNQPEMSDIFGQNWHLQFPELLEEFHSQGLLETVALNPAPVYSYANSIFPESIYRTILSGEKRELHHQIAKYFETRFAAQQSLYAGLIAYHYIQAGVQARIVHWSKVAADSYFHVGAYEQSRYYYQVIVDTSSDPDEICAAELAIADIALGQAKNTDAGKILKRYSFFTSGEAKPTTYHDFHRHQGRYIALYARLLNNQGKFKAVQSFLKQHIAEIRDQNLYLNTRLDYLETLMFGGQLQEFEQEALPLYKELKSLRKPMLRSKLAGVIAQYYTNIGAYKQAATFYRDKQSLAKHQNDKLNQRIASAGLGIIYSRLGSKTKAYKYFHQALSLAESIGDRNGYAKALLDLGVLHKNAGKYHEALESYQRSLTIARQLGNKLLCSIITYDIGELYYHQDNLDESLNYYQQSRALSESIADEIGISFCNDAIGDILFCQGKYDEAEALYLHNLERQTKQQDHEGIAHTYGNLGNIAKMKQDFATAMQYYRLQTDLLAEIGDKDGEGRAHFNTAMIHVEQGDNDNARLELGKALQLFEACHAQNFMDITRQQLEELSNK